MAKVATQSLVIELSTIVKNSDPDTFSVVDSQSKETIEDVISELFEGKYVVEVTTVE